MTIAPAWVAVSVRARAMAQQRVGAGGANRIAASGSLGNALTLLAPSIYGQRFATASSLIGYQHDISATILWQLRVLAGWIPAGGGGLTRAAAAGFELRNIAQCAQQIISHSAPETRFDLGTLGTAAAQFQAATMMTELEQILRRSSWGDAGHPQTIGALVDTLTISWLRRLAATAPASRDWAQYATVLVAARTVLVDGHKPERRLVELTRPFIGTEWSHATNLTVFSKALPRSCSAIIEGVTSPDELWRAEARLGVIIEADAMRLLRDPLPGPDIVLGALAVLAVDAWRLRAAIALATASETAAASAITAREEITHAMA